LIKELDAKGIKVEETRVHGKGPGYSVYITDPNGNRVELSKD
jgi:catechol 2,3-dioxygenase-like lactoylglutathione lyase family enzyme